MDWKKIGSNSWNMKNIFKLKFMVLSMQLSVTYALNREILTITYSDLFKPLIRSLSVEVRGIACDMIRGSWISELCLRVLSVLKVRCIGHGSKFGRWILSLIGKIHPMVAINCIMSYLPTDLTFWSLSFTLRTKWGLRVRIRGLWWLNLWCWISIEWSSTSTPIEWVSSPTSIVTLAPIETIVRFVIVGNCCQYKFV